jgi:vacuolar-type H+-ATPase subunit H
MGEPEKTLLQQIREKEQEYAEKIEGVKKETGLAVDAAKNEAEALLCTADGSGKTEAERLYWEGKGKIDAEIEALKNSAVAARDNAAAKGERNQSRAIDAITGYVTME